MYAVDVGREQFHARLRANPAVVPFEETDIRALDRTKLGELPDFRGKATFYLGGIGIGAFPSREKAWNTVLTWQLLVPAMHAPITFTSRTAFLRACDSFRAAPNAMAYRSTPTSLPCRIPAARSVSY